MSSKKTRLQLYADENFPVTSVTFLKSLGVSIIHTYDIGNVRKSDLFHLKFSKSKRRILLTLDRDFNSNWTTLKGHPGVILISSGTQTSKAINAICKRAFKKLTGKFVSESLVRITTDQMSGIRKERLRRLICNRGKEKFGEEN